MPDKKRTIEEENLMNLLSAALEAPVRADASPQPAVRRRWWPRFLAAVAAMLVVVVGALWLLSTGGGRTPGPAVPILSLAFPQAVAESLEKLKEVETVVVTSRVTANGQELTLHAYYKAPHSLREEHGAGQVLFDDGTRHVVLDIGEKRIIESGPSRLPQDPKLKGATMADMLHLRFKEADTDENVHVSGPTPDTLGATPCRRYEFTFTMPARPQLGITGSVWFSTETGLVLRMVRRLGSATTQIDYQYNVPLDDSLFIIPDWARVAK